MRGSLTICVLVAGCGRFHFDAIGGTSDADDADGHPVDGDSTVGPHTFGGLCALSSLTSIAGGYVADDMMSANMLASLTSACANTAMTRVVSQNDPGILDPSTDRPLLASTDLGIIGGGNNFERSINYLQMADMPLIFEDDTGSVIITERATSSILVNSPDASFSGSHDVCLIMDVVEAATGGDYLVVFGVNEYGTQAAGYYVTNTILPTIQTDAKHWYLVDWTDENANFIPDAADTYAIISSRP